MDQEVEDVIQRRAEFLIAELRSTNPRYDHPVRYTLRSLSNYVHIGKDLSSLGVSKLLRHRTKKVHELLLDQAGTPAQRWKACGKEINNDHPHPLRAIWDRLLAMPAKELSPDIVVRALREWPMVVVMRNEHINHHLGPLERYAELEVLTGDPISNAGWVRAPEFTFP